MRLFGNTSGVVDRVNWMAMPFSLSFAGVSVLDELCFDMTIEPALSMNINCRPELSATVAIEPAIEAALSAKPAIDADLSLSPGIELEIDQGCP